MEEMPNLNNPSEEIRILKKEEILQLEPGKLAEYLDELDKKGKLEEYLVEAVKDDALVAEISQWEKWYKPEQQKLIDQIIEERFSQEESAWELPLGLEKKYSADELILIFKNLVSLQLTFGCSKGCPACGADAVPGVRDELDFDKVKKFVQEFGKYLFRTYLYRASEPSDYERYREVYELIIEKSNYHPFTATNEYRDENWKKFLADYGENTRLSFFGKERDSQEVEDLRVREITGKGREKVPGIGVTRRDLGVRREEKEDYTGIGSSEWGTLLTPRGLYNTFPMPISDKFPLAEAVVPIEEINDYEPKEGDNIIDVARHKVIVARAAIDPLFDQIRDSLVKRRMKDRKKAAPPYVNLIMGESKEWIVQYDVDGQISGLEIFDRARLDHLGAGAIATDRFLWDFDNDYKIPDDKVLSKEELKEVRLFILSQKAKKTKAAFVQDDAVGWKLTVPKIGKIKIVAIKEEADRGLTSIMVLKDLQETKPVKT